MRRSSIKDYEGFYDITDDGQVISLARTVTGKDGVIYPFRERTIVQSLNKSTNCLTVHLWKDNKQKTFYVHRLVAEAFIPNLQNKPEVNHKDGNRQNNVITNLEWVTSSENKIHAIETGLKVYTNRLTREEFIECLDAVIEGESYASISERVSYKVPFLSVKLRKLAKELGIEDLLDNSLKLQKQVEASERGYATLAFGLRLRTPLLYQTVWNAPKKPYEAVKEAKTAGNALTQSYGLLTTRSTNMFLERVRNTSYKYSILPVAQIHDATYFIIRNKPDILHWVNINLVECMTYYDDLPELYHDQVKLEAELEIYYPSWADKTKIKNNASLKEIKDTLNTIGILT